MYTRKKYAMDKARKRASIPKYQVYNNALKDIYVDKSFQDVQMDRKLWGKNIRISRR